MSGGQHRGIELREIVVEVPTDVAWRITTGIGLGGYEVRGGEEYVSTSVEDFETFPLRDEASRTEFVREGGPDGGPVLDVHVDVGLGQVTIIETTPAGDADATTSDPDTDTDSPDTDTDSEELS